MIPMTFAELLANKYVRYAAGVVAVLALVWAFAVHFRHVGAVEARVDSAQQVADAIEKMHQSDKAAFEAQLAPLLSSAEDARKQAAAAHDLALAIVAQRQAATQQVAQMSDSAVDAAIAKHVGDLNLPEVRRQVLQCNEQLPLCEQQAKAAQDEAAKKAVEAAKWEAAYRATDSYVDVVERDYAQLYNVKATPVRSWKCLKVWRCRLPQVAVPSPSELKRPSMKSPQDDKG